MVRPGMKNNTNQDTHGKEMILVDRHAKGQLNNVDVFKWFLKLVGDVGRGQPEFLQKGIDMFVLHFCFTRDCICRVTK